MGHPRRRGTDEKQKSCAPQYIRKNNMNENGSTNESMISANGGNSNCLHSSNGSLLCDNHNASAVVTANFNSTGCDHDLDNICGVMKARGKKTLNTLNMNKLKSPLRQRGRVNHFVQQELKVSSANFPTKEGSEIFPYDKNWEERESKLVGGGESCVSVVPLCETGEATKSLVSSDQCCRSKEAEQGGSSRHCNGVEADKFGESKDSEMIEKSVDYSFGIGKLQNAVFSDKKSQVILNDDNSVSKGQKTIRSKPELNLEIGNCGDLDRDNIVTAADKNLVISTSSTDFSRFKESVACHSSIPSHWNSLDSDDLDSFYKHLETNSDSFNGSISRKRTLCSGSENTFDKVTIVKDGTEADVLPCKKLLLNNDKSNPTTSLSNSKKNQGVVLSSEKSPLNFKAPVTKPKIPNDCYVAIDCEMVGVDVRGCRSVLGRCSIVDYDGNVLYDRYVRPLEPVTDYRTRWSGIRPSHMTHAEPIWQAWRDIQECLRNKIVIGHSVKNDFDVIQFHPHRYLVRDTCRCDLLTNLAYQVQAEKGNSLKSLTKRILGRSIQCGRSGHDSVEDARATLELFKVVREEWELRIFNSWKGEGFDVMDFLQCLQDKKDINDLKGFPVLCFGQSGCDNGRTVGLIGVNINRVDSGNRDMALNVNNDGVGGVRSQPGVCYNGRPMNGVHVAMESDDGVRGSGAGWRRRDFHHSGANGVDYLSDEFWPSGVWF